MEENQTSQEIEFIKEKVKERPLNRKKLIRRTLLTASMAVIFGLIACLTFLVLEPVFTNLLYPEEEPRQVQLQEEDIEDEMRPEDMILEEETQTQPVAEVVQPVVEKVELEMSDYQRLYRLMYGLVQETEKSMVTVVGVVTDMDWFDNIYENQGQSAGLIVAENGVELLILTDRDVVESAESLAVVFSDETRVEGTVKSQDPQTGLAIVSVMLSGIPEKTREGIQTAVLGSSGSSILATPVIAMGRPLGSGTSIIYGMVTSADAKVNLVDHNVRRLTTDMVGDQHSSGVLVDLSGQVIGILRPTEEGHEGELLSAYSMADLRALIEKMSNGVRVAHLGVTGTDVPVSISEELGVPLGAYVTQIQMDSPAMEAGIQSGDVITRLGETEIGSFTDYQESLMDLLPGNEVTVTVMRQGPEAYQEMLLEAVPE